MSSIEIIVIILVLAAAGFRLYQKYAKKDSGKTGTYSRKEPRSSFSSHTKDDDYEPYLKK